MAPQNNKRRWDNTFKEAPPTRNPSMSSFLAKSAELAALTDPADVVKYSD